MVSLDLTDRDFKEPWRAQTAGAPLKVQASTVAEQSLATYTGSGIILSVQFTVAATSPGSITDVEYIYAFFEIIPNGESDTGEGIYVIPCTWDNTETSTRKSGALVIPCNVPFSNGCTIKVTIGSETGTYTNVAGVVHVTAAQ